MSRQFFTTWLEKEGLSLSKHQLKQFDEYFHLLVEWNKKMNLTGITEEDEVYEKHFYDSLTVAFFHDFTKVKKVIDIGAGAGFPSLPLKIAYPHLEVVIVDSLKKRITFLEHVAEHIGIDKVQFMHGRAEELARKKELREQFDVALARAVARMPVLTELCLPFVQKNGSFLAMKGASGLEEKEEAGKAISQLGGKWGEAYSLKLPGEESERSILKVEKVKETPKAYPRKPGTPAKQPIV
ncbi:16S rRNA (guanine(527)-N(7))-methyltransferase RsmG [Thalassorhabdus alkalitolerans]|uniref:Ribosomal RNA small subunit methyltransferase G n=1 Tax=Thalassorhabdus alkalitolerans TaxID=2282697 RepID=A0ABW0YIY9_9BACI|nr:16S rRNA (guanine(527)-N(7))-methyltransferase RsmG [Thalassobacillus sp. C254]